MSFFDRLKRLFRTQPPPPPETKAQCLARQERERNVLDQNHRNALAELKRKQTNAKNKFQNKNSDNKSLNAFLRRQQSEKKQLENAQSVEEAKMKERHAYERLGHIGE